MQKMPPHEQNDSLDDSRKARGQETFTSRQRRHTFNSQRLPRDYYNDEHPEVPVTKRASLHLQRSADYIPVASEAEQPRRSRATHLLNQKLQEQDETSIITKKGGEGPSRSARAPRQRSVNVDPLTRPKPSDYPTQPSRRSLSRVLHEPVDVSQFDAVRARARNVILPEELPPAYQRGKQATKSPEARANHKPGAKTSHAITPPNRLRKPYSYNRSMDSYQRPVTSYAPKREHQRRQILSPFAPIREFTRHNQIAKLGGITLALLLALILATAVFDSLVPGSQLLQQHQGSESSEIGDTSVHLDQHQLIITPPKTDHPAPPVFAHSAYLFDVDTGATLYAYNPFQHLPLMSTTKMMTALLAAKAGNPGQNVTIDDAIAHDIDQLSADSSLMGIKKGETYTLKELLYGMMLPSGNDAAVAIADHVAGNQDKFVAQMNDELHTLGVSDTHFVNPHGLLDNNQYSSAHDLAIIAKASFSDPLVHEIVSTKTFSIAKTDQHESHELRNGDQFLWWYPGTDGGKTGWDAATNFVQVVSCVRNQHHLIGVLMHTVDWWTDMRDLMNWGFNSFNWISPRDVDRSGTPIPYDADWNYFSRDKKENTIPLPNQGRFYVYTGYSVANPIQDYFDHNGSVGTFGFPTSQARTKNDTTISQAFEHGSISCDLSNKKCKKD